MVDTIIEVFRELKHIECETPNRYLISLKLTKTSTVRCYVTQMTYEHDDISISYYTSDSKIISFSYFTYLSEYIKEQIYDYIRENYTEYEYIFSSKEMGLL